MRMHCPLEYTFHLEPILGDEAAARAQLPTSEMLASGGVGAATDEGRVGGGGSGA